MSVWAPPVSGPHPPHVTYEKSGLRIASTSLRSMGNASVFGVQLGVPELDSDASQGTSNERALSSASCGSHERTQRFSVAGSADAFTWCRRPMPCCPTAIHSPPDRTLNLAWLWKQQVMSLRNVGLFGLPGSIVRSFVVSSRLGKPKRPTFRWSVYASMMGASRGALRSGLVPGAPNGPGRS